MTLNKSQVTEIARLLRIGNYEKHVFQALGISASTWEHWKARARDYLERSQSGERLIFPSKRKASEAALLLEFLEAIKRGRALAINRNLSIIQQAAAESWQAAAWYLERVAPKEFGRKERFEISQPETGLYDDLTDEEVHSEIATLDKVLTDARSNPATKN